MREGLDLPEVSLVGILDADQEGFLRSKTSLTQTIGRAARHVHGKAIFYADRITQSMAACIEETNHRREVQLRYNEEHGITPHAVKKELVQAEMGTAKRDETVTGKGTPASLSIAHYQLEENPTLMAADPISEHMSAAQLQKSIDNSRRLMQEAAKRLDFMEAAHYRDEVVRLEALLKEKQTQ